MNKDEIEKLKKEAAEHAAEDQKKRELIDARNEAESLVYVAEKGLKDAGDKVSAVPIATPFSVNALTRGITPAALE